MNTQSVYTISAGALKGPIGNSSGGRSLRDITPQKNQLNLISPSTDARRSPSFYSFFIYQQFPFQRADYTETPLSFYMLPSPLRGRRHVFLQTKQEVDHGK